MNTVRASAAACAVASPLLVLALASTATSVDAQFTTAVVPPPPVPVIDTAASADSARRAQELLVERMTSIKEWVDSAAAALAEAPPVAPDSADAAPPAPASGDSLPERGSPGGKKEPIPADSTDSLSASPVRRSSPASLRH